MTYFFYYCLISVTLFSCIDWYPLLHAWFLILDLFPDFHSLRCHLPILLHSPSTKHSPRCNLHTYAVQCSTVQNKQWRRGRGLALRILATLSSSSKQDVCLSILKHNNPDPDLGSYLSLSYPIFKIGRNDYSLKKMKKKKKSIPSIDEHQDPIHAAQQRNELILPAYLLRLPLWDWHIPSPPRQLSDFQSGLTYLIPPEVMDAVEYSDLSHKFFGRTTRASAFVFSTSPSIICCLNVQAQLLSQFNLTFSHIDGTFNWMNWSMIPTN